MYIGPNNLVVTLPTISDQTYFAIFFAFALIYPMRRESERFTDGAFNRACNRGIVFW